MAVATLSVKGNSIGISVWGSLVPDFIEIETDLLRLFFSSGRFDRFSIFVPMSELPQRM